MTGLLKRMGSKDTSRKDFDPILANRSRSWESSMASRKSKSQGSSVASSTDLSLAYSSDTEVREMLEQYGSQKEVRVTPSIVYPPSESNGLPPRTRSTKSISSYQKPPLFVRTPKEEAVQGPPANSLAMKTTCTMNDVEKSAQEFETFVTARVDMALSPVEDKVETFLFETSNMAKKTVACVPSMKQDQPTGSKATASCQTSFLSGLLGSLFNDEPIPVLPAASSLSRDESSAATEQSSIDSQHATPVHKNEERPKFVRPSYEKMMQTLLRDEAMPEPLEPGIPSSIEINRVA